MMQCCFCLVVMFQIDLHRGLLKSNLTFPVVNFRVSCYQFLGFKCCNRSPDMPMEKMKKKKKQKKKTNKQEMLQYVISAPEDPLY